MQTQGDFYSMSVVLFELVSGMSTDEGALKHLDKAS